MLVNLFVSLGVLALILYILVHAERVSFLWWMVVDWIYERTPWATIHKQGAEIMNLKAEKDHLYQYSIFEAERLHEYINELNEELNDWKRAYHQKMETSNELEMKCHRLATCLEEYKAGIERHLLAGAFTQKPRTKRKRASSKS